MDVRGMTADEAILEVERFLDLAFRMRLPSVVIIHGKGTGVLRQAVAECVLHLACHALRLGLQADGVRQPGGCPSLLLGGALGLG